MKKAKRKKDEVLWKEAERLHNDCTKRLRNARANYIRESLENKKGNNGTVNFDLHDYENNISIMEKDTANYINDYFVSIGSNLARQNTETWNFTGNQTDKKLDDVQTNIEEIIQFCKNTNINKSSCIENVSVEILKDAFLAVPNKIMDL